MMKINIYDDSKEFYSELEKVDYDTACSYINTDYEQCESRTTVYCSVEGTDYDELVRYMERHPQTFSSFISYIKEDVVFIEIA